MFVRKILIKARQNAIITSLEENKRDPRRFWRVLNCDLGLSNKKSGGTKGFSRIRSDKGEVLEGIEAC